MPVFEGEKYLQETLDSIQNQTRLPNELVISDDSLTDPTSEIIRRFSLTAKFPVKYLRHKQEGITANYINALKFTNGDIVIFSDQDDIWLKDKIEIITEVFEENSQVVIVSSDSELVNYDLKSLGTTLRGGTLNSRRLARLTNRGEDYLCFLTMRVPLLAHTLAIRSSCKEDILNRPVQPKEWWFENWVADVALSCGRLFLIREVLTLYRQHVGQTAGAPMKSSIILKSNLKNYKKRIEQLKYCRVLMNSEKVRGLLGEKSLKNRLRIQNNYILFLENRVNTLERKGLSRFFHSTILLISGKYHKYSSGFLSFAKDILQNQN
jgi:glycosyltransferase involved in cell wall biosynthesis